MKKLITLAALLAPTAAFAHSGHGEHDLLTGILHPITGADHMTAMVAVGLWAAVMGGKATWRLPLAFMAAMILGALVAMTGVGLVGVEVAIAASVLVMGVVLASKVSLSAKAGSLMVMLFAIFHGYAHGAEMPVSATAVVYFAGFVAATGALHAMGAAVGMWLIKAKLDKWAFRITGSVMALFGGSLLVS